MTRSSWLLVGVSALGVLLGWWLMGALARSESERPPLIPRIQSLPAFQELPALATGKRDLVDSLESPGASVWILLGPDPARADSLPLVCGFPRGPEGAVLGPECSLVAPELRAHFRNARFALGGQAPIVVLPAPGADEGVRALNARSGESVPIDRVPEGLAARAERGTRLVRTFRLDSPSRVAQTSPSEASYTGPVSGYAATLAPGPLLDHGSTRVSSCVTPGGYIQAREAGPSQGPLGSGRPVKVSFHSRGEKVAETAGRLPNDTVIEAPFACDATHGLFTWLGRGGSLSELSCSMKDCTPTTSKQPDIDDANVLGLGRAGASVVLLWRGAQGEPLVRLGPMADFAHSPSAPLWKPGSRDWELVKLLSAGQSLLVLIQGDALKAIQIHADGKLEALAPKARAN